MAEPKWLIVVDRGHAELYDLLCRGLREESRVLVTWDRRGTSSSRRPGPPERRHVSPSTTGGVCYVAVEAAAPPAAEASAVGNGAGTNGHGGLACPTCGVVCAYDAPTFPISPARLEILVVHGSSYQHTVEIQAFSASGRLLISHRTRARRRDAW
jgi:hypothetical protein